MADGEGTPKEEQAEQWNNNVTAPMLNYDVIVGSPCAKFDSKMGLYAAHWRHRWIAPKQARASVYLWDTVNVDGGRQQQNQDQRRADEDVLSLSVELW